MGKVKDELLFTLIRNYLVVYLPVHRQASEHTVRAYRTAWNQLLRYTAEKRNIRVMSVTMEMLDYDTITSYLEWLTEEKKVSVSTRNLRLAAIRAFFSYASACKPEYIDRVSELSVIKTARGDRFAAVDYMTEDAVKALLDTPDISTRIGIRDRFFMAFLYDTGSRVQEVLNVKICDLKIDKKPG